MDELEQQAEKVRASGALGRSPVIQRLFDYLLERSRDGVAPKEVEVAEAVFGRSGGFDISQDSTVRVYVHRLRGKLDDFYRGPGRDEPARLTIPKGEYRLVATPQEREAEAVAAPTRRLHRWAIPALAGLVALNILAGGLLFWRHSQTSFGFARNSIAWSELLRDERPILLVVGDYFIFGEIDDGGQVTRMIRDFEINSSEDLSQFQMANPQFVDRYTDLDLQYLPTSVASALRNLMPVLAETPKERERVRVVSASHLTPDMLKRNNIVYVGYISGLGLLQRPVFNTSRFEVGETYDELIDRQTGQIYVSLEGPRDIRGETRPDYGYFAAFEGPDGNRIVVVAGTRDVAVMHTAEALSSRAGLRELEEKIDRDAPFEALYEVDALDRVNLRGKLVTASPRRAANAPAAR